jgi:uncharacterized membrane protein YkvA (DUF1232 family)
MESRRKLETTKDKAVAFLGALCLLYLLNPTMGFFELIPDRLPIIGNIDEVFITGVLLKCLAYFGYNPFQLFNKNK